MQDYFDQASAYLQDSNCAKIKLGAVIVKNNVILSTACNLCAPNGNSYNDRHVHCLRMDVTSGTGYELCKGIHAEVIACLNIRPGRTIEELAQFANYKKPAKKDILSAFTAEEKTRLKNATMYLAGHYYSCDGCKRFLAILGIRDIRFKESRIR
ncbi:hypothetical protein A2973_02865 [Candidatus Gottesmanbacteria bacterium RIFCSPLOWO2_01_FULL_49_10]|uniref:CMP/dCMP-type deaminase domain-containing protein n=1 Tax=Candidatus Gottesmanbacteria bacterium RIFCSPLOWO2_01_FULL_49_10 TaxID=1798396 RepID=A0A1F6AY94_9BACT|nr:MAG: hypothetical protein A2973_02865 [Candidatus Gottesmanbacteria bacterium RIFCSPLOWO2_01_FULL_49_10]